MKHRWLKRRELQYALGRETGCGLQHTGWPCNSCFHAMAFAGVDGDTLHRMWHATLVLRGDYKNGQYDIDFATDADLSNTIDRLLLALSGAPEGGTRCQTSTAV